MSNYYKRIDLNCCCCSIEVKQPKTYIEDGFINFDCPFCGQSLEAIPADEVIEVNLNIVKNESNFKFKCVNCYHLSNDDFNRCVSCGGHEFKENKEG